VIFQGVRIMQPWINLNKQGGVNPFAYDGQNPAEIEFACI
jgi:hypothetical protein